MYKTCKNQFLLLVAYMHHINLIQPQIFDALFTQCYPHTTMNKAVRLCELRTH